MKTLSGIVTVEEVREKREAREAAAAAIAALLPDGEYYASGNEVRMHGSNEVFAICAEHWDACLVMMAAHEMIANRKDVR